MDVEQVDEESGITGNHDRVCDHPKQHSAERDPLAAVTLHRNHGEDAKKRNGERNCDAHHADVVFAQQRRRNREAEDCVVGAKHAEDQHAAAVVVLAKLRHKPGGERVCHDDADCHIQQKRRFKHRVDVRNRNCAIAHQRQGDVIDDFVCVAHELFGHDARLAQQYANEHIDQQRRDNVEGEDQVFHGSTPVFGRFFTPNGTIMHALYHTNAKTRLILTRKKPESWQTHVAYRPIVRLRCEFVNGV